MSHSRTGGRAVRRRAHAVGLMALALGLLAPPAGAQSGLVRIFGVGVPSAPGSRWGTRNTVIFNVRVRNDSTDPAPCLVRVELQGVAASSASPITSVPAGSVTLIPVSVDVDLRAIPSGGDRLPFTVVLLNSRREAINRFPGTLAVTPVAAGPLAIMPDLSRRLGFSRDLAIERIGYAAAHGDVSAGFVVVVRNRGLERWAYLASLGSQIALGTPETRLDWSDRLILGSPRVPPGLAPGDSAVIVLRLQPVSVSTSLGTVRMAPNLPTELWLTARVFLSSSFDVNPSNDAYYYVLRLDAAHHVAESRTLPAPPLTVRVNPQ